MSDLKLGHQSQTTPSLNLSTNMSTPEMPTAPSGSGAGKAPKKKSGCGCFLVGCLVFLFLAITVPTVGGYIMLKSFLSEEGVGSMVMSLTQLPGFHDGFKDGIRNSTDLTEEQKNSFIQVYDQVVAKYSSFSEEDKVKLHKNIGTVIRILVFEADTHKEPPPEFIELLNMLGLEDISNSLPQGSTGGDTTVTPTTPPSTTPVPAPTPTPTTPSGGADPFSFDLPTGTTPAPAPAPAPSPTTGPSTTPYDF